ncbi:putative aldouronate transport system substrate-binding protein [Paenibacillus algorifonticola]|uniref:Putative aldouronate transport system substrate-binding protein n=1 Tax=Paenibacillus algorifonticola TaxID=684063 RepID=A0A1I2C052_9BACL|nr:extracellular solute-binding protein [Paenibacillus algorifonticola]SFE61826.1 putative aldouronate transport system substrate-binding protein [Paenibacillus algorifonticola]
MKLDRTGIAVFVLVGLLLLASCSLKENKSVSGGEGKREEAPTELHVFALQEPGIELGTNDFTRYLEQKFNVHFNWEFISPDGAREKRQISLAGGDYPDAYFLTAYIDQFSQSDLLKYGKQGVIMPLNELIAKYAPNVKAAMTEHSDLKALSTAPDGNIYGLPAYSECFHCSYPNKMWVNDKWLAKLGLDVPTTTEEFKEMLEAFNSSDPNGNGLADEVPLSGSTEDFGVRIIPYLMNGFIYHDDRHYLMLTDGKVETVADKPRWKEGLAYIRSLYKEGLIDPGAFIQNAEALKRIGDNDGAPMLGVAAGMHPAIFAGERMNDYVPIPPLVGPYASYATYQGGGMQPGAKFVITNRASKEAQRKLIEIVNYMYTPEGQTTSQNGLEGIGWRKPQAGEQALGAGVKPLFTSLILINEAESTNSGWSGMAHLYMPREYRDSWVAGSDMYTPDGYERRLYEATMLYEGHEPSDIFPIWTLWLDPTEADEAGILHTNLTNYIEQSTLRFITGDWDLDKDWNGYVAGLHDMRIQRYVEIMQRAYDLYKK